jgi:F0F1-type ATP synthase membrane subunit b/b'
MLQFDATFIVVLLSFIVFMLWMKQVYFEPVAAVKRQRLDAMALTKTQTATMLAQAADHTAHVEAQLKQARDEAHHLTETARQQAKQTADERLQAQRNKTNAEAGQQVGAIEAHMVTVQAELMGGKEALVAGILAKLLPLDVAERWSVLHQAVHGREG